MSILLLLGLLSLALSSLLPVDEGRVSGNFARRILGVEHPLEIQAGGHRLAISTAHPYRHRPLSPSFPPALHDQTEQHKRRENPTRMMAMGMGMGMVISTVTTCFERYFCCQTPVERVQNLNRFCCQMMDSTMQDRRLLPSQMFLQRTATGNTNDGRHSRRWRWCSRQYPFSWGPSLGVGSRQSIAISMRQGDDLSELHPTARSAVLKHQA